MADVWRPPGEAFVFRLPFQAARALRGRKLGVIHLRGSFPSARAGQLVGESRQVVSPWVATRTFCRTVGRCCLSEATALETQRHRRS